MKIYFAIMLVLLMMATAYGFRVRNSNSAQYSCPAPEKIFTHLMILVFHVIHQQTILAKQILILNMIP